MTGVGPGSMRNQMKAAASAIFAAGLEAVTPENCINRWVRYSDGVLQVGRESFHLDEIDRIYVVGAGKASAAMAGAVETLLGDRLADGVVVTKYGHGVALRRCRLLESGHPVPDENGVRASQAILDLIARAGPRDLILCLVSGGGSALIPAPAQGISLADKQVTTRQLLACGATIHEINTIRKHLSRIKGGRLCREAHGARMVSLIISDVVGDDLDIIASGMTAPDSSTFAACLDILARYDLTGKVPQPVRHLLTMGADGKVQETPKPGDPLFHNVHNQIVGSLAEALAAAEQEAGRQGYRTLILTAMLCGEAREVAKVLSAVAIRVVKLFELDTRCSVPWQVKFNAPADPSNPRHVSFQGVKPP